MLVTFVRRNNRGLHRNGRTGMRRRDKRGNWWEMKRDEGRSEGHTTERIRIINK